MAASWQTAQSIDAGNFLKGLTLVANGTDIYVFGEKNSTHDIYYLKNIGGSGWTDGGILETGTYNTVKAKWAYWVDYDSGGTNRGAKTGGTNGSRTELDYIFLDETATPDIQWNSLSLATTAINKILKYFNGSTWTTKPLKYHNGSSWVTKPLKVNL